MLPAAPLHSRIDVLASLREALLAFVLALVVFGPVSGLMLSGYRVEPHWLRPLLLAAVVAAGRFAIHLLGQTPAGRRMAARNQARVHGGVTVAALGQSPNRARLLLVFVLLGAFVIPFLPWLPVPDALAALGGKYWLSNLILALIYVLLGLGLNIVVGLAGLLDLGFVAFYAVGAYFLALGAQYLGIGFWTALVCAPLLAACCGAVLGFPVLRMHGDYLAIVTLGFGEIIRLVLNNWLEFTGGPNGAPVPPPTFFGLEFTRTARQGGTPIHEFLGIEYNTNLKLVFVYLVLAAQYESWIDPAAVVLTVPMALVGVVAALTVRAFPTDLYTQIGRLTPLAERRVNTIERYDRAPDGRHYSSHYVMTYFTLDGQSVVGMESYVNEYLEVNGIWMPLRRHVSFGEQGTVRTRVIELSQHEVW